MKIFLSILLLFSLSVSAQNTTPNFLSPPVKYDAGREAAIIGTEGVLFVGAMVGLNYLWYKKFPRSKFHLFNDNSEWLQMDKVGHATTAYIVGVIGMEALRCAGVKQNNAIWYGGLTGFAFQTTIEVFDGFSSEWGFSTGDMIANASGAALAIGQQLGWNEQRIQLKYSFHASIYSSYRPDELGKKLIESALKDYNGQTYWLSGNLSSFMKADNNFPKWLDVSVGYGAEGMLGGTSNPEMVNGVKMPVFERTRRVLFSVDADLSRIQTNSSGLNGTLELINFIKFPAPALEYKFVPAKLYFRPFYF